MKFYVCINKQDEIEVLEEFDNYEDADYSLEKWWKKYPFAMVEIYIKDDKGQFVFYE